MTLQKDWPAIKTAYEKIIAKTKVAAFSTVYQDGNPHVTPIGSLILRDDATGFFFDRFPRQLKENLDANPRVAVMTVNTGFFYWFGGLRKGRFKTPPGIRLYGSAGPLRQATAEEAAAWQGIVRRARGTKGYDILWKDMDRVRDIHFDRARLVKAGAMTEGLGF